jgi:hypothetical protein
MVRGVSCADAIVIREKPLQTNSKQIERAFHTASFVSRGD